MAAPVPEDALAVFYGQPFVRHPVSFGPVIERDVLSEQFDFLMDWYHRDRFARSWCSCGNCTRFRRVRDLLMTPFERTEVES